MLTAEVKLWGRSIGAVALADGDRTASFEYDPKFAKSGIQVAKLMMPLGRQIYRFPELSFESFKGLPGMLADSLPDKFGNALINAWLAEQGRTPESFSSIERLCYLGSRGMGALEFAPAIGRRPKASKRLEIDSLVKLASEILSRQKSLRTSLADRAHDEAMKDILLVGTSAGGARAKAVIAMNDKTREIRSGQVEAGEGFGYWIIKFDGVDNNRDKEAADKKGYGAIEYAYHLMAKAAGISMTECRLLPDNDRRHFMTRRFDRTASGEKLHMQSLGALQHLDFNVPGAHSYEQAFQTIQLFRLPAISSEEMYRRMVFNIVARNQDDHVKNISFLMNKEGTWSLSPAYDIMYSYNPGGKHTNLHQMTMKGRRDGFTLADFSASAQVANLKQGRETVILREVIEAVSEWEKFAAQAEVPAAKASSIKAAHRLAFS